MSVLIILDVDLTPLRPPPKALMQRRADVVAAIPGGMVSGRPSVAVVSRGGDAGDVLLEMSLREFLAAAAALRARYGDDPQPEELH